MFKMTMLFILALIGFSCVLFALGFALPPLYYWILALKGNRCGWDEETDQEDDGNCVKETSEKKMDIQFEDVTDIIDKTWIDANEKLPEIVDGDCSDFVIVNCADKKWNAFTTVDRIANGKWEWYGSKVTAWQELPEAKRM